MSDDLHPFITELLGGNMNLIQDLSGMMHIILEDEPQYWKYIPELCDIIVKEDSEQLRSDAYWVMTLFLNGYQDKKLATFFLDRLHAEQSIYIKNLILICLSKLKIPEGKDLRPISELINSQNDRTKHLAKDAWKLQSD